MLQRAAEKEPDYYGAALSQVPAAAPPLPMLNMFSIQGIFRTAGMWLQSMTPAWTPLAAPYTCSQLHCGCTPTSCNSGEQSGIMRGKGGCSLRVPGWPGAGHEPAQGELQRQRARHEVLRQRGRLLAAGAAAQPPAPRAQRQQPCTPGCAPSRPPSEHEPENCVVCVASHLCVMNLSMKALSEDVCHCSIPMAILCLCEASCDLRSRCRVFGVFYQKAFPYTL